MISDISLVPTLDSVGQIGILFESDAQDYKLLKNTVYFNAKTWAATNFINISLTSR